MRLGVGLGLFAISCGEPGFFAGDDPSSQEASRTRRQLSRELRDLVLISGIPILAEPPEVPDELYALGKSLAHDKILSGNQDVSCTTCHVVGLGTDDDLPLPIGVGGTGVGADRQLGSGRRFIPRNAPSLFNVYATDNKFWDGRVSVDLASGALTTPAGPALTQDMVDVFEFGSLAAQAMFPPTDRREMRGKLGESELGDLADDDFQAIWAGIMDRLGAIPEYVLMFEAAYPGTAFEDMTFAHAANAIAGYEVRAFARKDTPFDAFLDEIPGTMTRAQLRGGILFYSTAHCNGCHSGPNLSNQLYFNSGMAQLGPGEGDGAAGTDDYGRERVTGMFADRFRFRSPPLRNVELTAPYGHAGQIATLEELMVHYQQPEDHLLAYDVTAQVDDPRFDSMFVDNRAEVLASLSPFMLNAVIADTDIPDLVAFLESLTDDSARDLCAEVPQHVPSDLPVDDPCVGP